MVTFNDLGGEWRSGPPKVWLPSGNCCVTNIRKLLPELNTGLVGIGVDPGRNFAIAMFDCNELRVMYGQFDKADSVQYGEWAYTLMTQRYAPLEWPCTVEGAAYHAHYGQVGLAYERFGFYLAMRKNAQIVPPATIRAQVLGKGNFNTKRGFKDIGVPHDAGDAILCAFHAAEVSIDITDYLDEIGE